MSPENEELLTLTEAAKFLDISKSTIYRLLDQGNLRSFKVGRQWRFKREDLNAYLTRSPVAILDAPTDDLDREIAHFVQDNNVSGMELPGEGEKPEPGSAEDKIRILVSHIIYLAFKSRASDIHLESLGRGKGAKFVLRLRIDGAMHEVRSFPISLREAVMACFKTLGGVDPSQSRSPQRGRVWAQIDGKDIDIRFTSTPTLCGESLVARLFDQAVIMMKVDDLQLGPDHERFTSWLKRPNGLILYAGPTGSGKTTVLYSALQSLVRPETKVISVEDPVEFALPGVTQIQVDKKSDLSFATGIQTVMGMDPDVVMLSDVEHAATLKGACQLALTGHLVLSSIHTPSAAASLERLRNWDVEPFVVANAMIGVSCQRLIRKLCVHCKEPADVSPATLARAQEIAEQGGWSLPDDAVFMKAVGCDKCTQGYRGRTAIFELLEFTSDIREAFLEGASASELQRIAISEGMSTMATNGFRKAAQGISTINEVLRVVAS